MRLHLNKKGIRVLGVAESFRQSQRRSLLAGVVMRGDLVVDGVAFGSTSVGGDDATDSILKLYRSLKRNDVNLMMVSGAILSLYNIVDVDQLSRRASVPVVCLTYKETAGIEGAIARKFPGRAQAKLRAYRKLGPRKGIKLSSGHTVYARASGISTKEAHGVVNAALIFHSYEALLAAAFIFSIHFFNTHLRPEVFPVDEVIFSGVMPLHELEEDYPGWYRRMRDSGRLAARYVDEAACTGCQQCETACTVAVPDQFNADLVARRAAY
ncbi:MAG: DUF99 family protein, partial [Nitrososphaerota archaeon]|nr:DUF99 family protein [Nitrososphaerota archaeon]